MMGAVWRRFFFLSMVVFLIPMTQEDAYAYPNVPTVTLGGLQFWTDRATRSGWRIQCHALTGHCRLLDPRDVRRGWGSADELEARLNTIEPSSRTAPDNTRIVLLVHGLGGNAWTFQRLARILKNDGHRVVQFTYASAFAPLPDHATALRNYVERIDNAEEVVFITHSMGGLIVDHALSSGGSMADMRVVGVVRLGTPSEGSVLAEQIVDLLGTSRLRQTPLEDIATGQADPAVDMSLSHCNIAGSLRGGSLNPWIPGDNDGLVGVDEVSAGQSTNTLVVKASHFGLTANSEVIAVVRNFLRRRVCSSSSDT